MFVQAWNIKLCLNKLSRFSIHSREKNRTLKHRLQFERIGRLHKRHQTGFGGKYILNEGSRYVQKHKHRYVTVCTQISCFTLEQIHRKLKTLPVSRSKFRNSILVYVSKMFLKHVLATLLRNMKCSPLHDGDFYFSWTINKHNIFYKILVLGWQIAGKCVKSSGVLADLAPPKFGLPGPNPLADMDRGSKFQLKTEWKHHP